MRAHGLAGSGGVAALERIKHHFVLGLHQLLALTLLSNERLRMRFMLSSTWACMEAIAEMKNWFPEARATAR